jgi:AraC-like DNA-binding protein
MGTSEAYGSRFGDKFGLESAPVLIARALSASEIAATEVRSDNPRIAPTDSIAREDGYLVGLQFREYPAHVYWEDGKQAPMTSLRAGETVFYDLKRDPVALIDKPFHSIHFYLPRAALVAIADDANAPAIGELAYQPGAGVLDATIRSLGTALLPAFEQPERVNRLFVDHVTLAVAVHVAQAYGGMRAGRGGARGGLAPWQEKRAKDLIGADLSGEVPLRVVAREVGLSPGHFTRAFRKSTGVAPHQWLLRQRVTAAKAMLRDAEHALLDVARACGFADQSHLTRVFTRFVGQSPGAWRRWART